MKAGPRIARELLPCDIVQLGDVDLSCTQTVMAQNSGRGIGIDQHSYNSNAFFALLSKGAEMDVYSVRIDSGFLLPKQSQLKVCRTLLVGWYSGELQWLAFRCLLQISVLSFHLFKTCLFKQR